MLWWRDLGPDMYGWAEIDRWSVVSRATHKDFQGIRFGMGGEVNGIGGFFQGETMCDKAAHVHLPGEDEAGDFFLQGEVGGVAAEEVFLVDADGGQVGGEEAGGD